MFSKFFIFCLFLLSFNLDAQNPIKGLGMGALASSTGIGAEFSYHPYIRSLNSWRLRVAYTHVAFQKPQQLGMDKGKSIDLRPNLQKKVAQLLLDFFPFKQKRWHMSTGLAYNVDQTYRFEVSTETGVSLGGIDIEANDFGAIRGGIKWNTWMPYLGFGYLANLYREKIWLNIDMGTYYMGSPKLDISYDGFLETTTLDGEIPKIEHNLRNYSYYPYISLGLGWKF